ncbi:unnamed protein product [Absidia cylindrospora]
MSWNLPFNARNRQLYLQTRSVTLSLYRSLLKTARQFTAPHEHWFLNHTIRERFRFHECETSRKKALHLLSEGDEALQQMKLALEGNLAVKNYIDQLASAKIGPLAHAITKLRRIPDLLQRSIAAADIRSQASRLRNTRRSDRMILPSHLIEEARLPMSRVPSSRRLYKAAIALMTQQKKEQRQKPKKQIVLKPYQVKRASYASSGFMFVERRGFRQPTRTGMMMKNRAKTQQKRLDESNRLMVQKNDLLSESLFLKQLGVTDDTNEYLTPIYDSLKQISKYTRCSPPAPTTD